MGFAQKLGSPESKQPDISGTGAYEVNSAFFFAHEKLTCVNIFSHGEIHVSAVILILYTRKGK